MLVLQATHSMGIFYSVLKERGRLQDLILRRMNQVKALCVCVCVCVCVCKMQGHVVRGLHVNLIHPRAGK